MQKNSYNKLREHYKSMLELCDVIHFNSTLTEQVYRAEIDIKNSKVLTITNSLIHDNRVMRSYESKKLNLIFIGNTTTYKGFPILKEVLMELYNCGVRDWHLDVWGSIGESKECEAIDYRGYYSSSELLKVYKEDGLLIVPSLCNETFSLVTLEAISFGVPVLVSSTVGAKDIVNEYDTWFIFRTKEELKSKLQGLISDRSKLIEFNSSILSNKWRHSIESHSKEIINIYK